MIHDKNIMNIADCYSVDDKNKITWFHDKFGSYLINTLNIYSKNKTIYIYKDGIFVRDEFELMRAIQNNCKNAKENFRKEVYRYCEISAPVLDFNDDVNLIGCQNGIYDIKHDMLLNFAPTYFMQHKINATYNPKAYSQDVDNLLNSISCNDKNIRMLIEEMIGYCLHRNCRYQKMFLLKGFGKNGKSTLINMIINFIGEQNTSALSLTDLQDKFKKAELQDCLVNICDDLSNCYIKDTQDFKKLVTGGETVMERKNQHPFKYRNYAKLILAANDIPKSNDKSDGYYRRFIFVPLNAKFSPKMPNFDPNIDDKVSTEQARSYLLNIAIAGLNRLKQNGYFTSSDLSETELTEYKEENDPIIKFVNEYTEAKINNNTTEFIYKEFNDWYKNNYNKFSDYNKTTLTRSLKNNFDFECTPKNIGGKSERCYIKQITLSTPKQTVMCNIQKEMEVVNDDDLPF